MDTIKNITSQKYFKIILWGISGLIIILGAFAAGINVGLHKARYSYQWGANYERNFMGVPGRGDFGPRGVMEPRNFGGPADMMRGFEGRDFRNPHGVAGSVVSINGSTIVVKDRDGKENTVSTSDKTLFKKGRDTISISDLKTDDKIVVLGKPGDGGTVNADLIRLFN